MASHLVFLILFDAKKFHEFLQWPQWEGKWVKKTQRVIERVSAISLEILGFVKESGGECALSGSLPDSWVSTLSPIKGFSSQTGLIENAKGW